MDFGFECFICFTGFSSIRKPKSLNCGHSLCEVCLNDILKSKSRLCPMCQSPILNPETLPYNYSILDRLNFIEVKCKNHPGVLASHFQTKSIETLCQQCSKKSVLLNLIEISNIDFADYIINRAIELEIANTQRLSPEIRAKIRKIPSSDNSTKVKYLKELVDSLDSIYCGAHKLQGLLVNIQKAEVYCNSCPKTGGEMNITDPRLPIALDHQIRTESFKIDCYMISQFHRNTLIKLEPASIEQKISLLHYLLSKKIKQIPGILPAICFKCNQEFMYPNNLPCKIPCQGTHFICEMCSKISFKCPIDDSDFIPTTLEKVNPKISACCVCGEICCSSNLPILMPCGVVQCKKCVRDSVCRFCECQHVISVNEAAAVSKFYLQIFDSLGIRCKDGNPAKYFDADEMMAYCSACRPNRKVAKISRLDLEVILINRCNQKASELGNKITPILSKQLSELRFSSNSTKYELYKLLITIGTPLKATQINNPKGIEVPSLQLESPNLLRFHSVLPNPSMPSSIKPWYIDKAKQQIEIISFQVFRSICLIGVSITCPIKNEVGILEYLEVIEGDGIGGEVKERCLENFEVKGIVADLYLANRVALKEMQVYSVVFKYNATLVYRGNPLDKCQLVGSDGTEFEIVESKPRGHYTNGQAHISGPLIRLIYQPN